MVYNKGLGLEYNFLHGYPPSMAIWQAFRVTPLMSSQAQKPFVVVTIVNLGGNVGLVLSDLTLPTSFAKPST